MAPIVLPNTQALNCSTFRPPRHELEQGNMAIPEFYDWNATHNPQHPVFIFDDDNGLQSIVFSQAVKMIHRAAYYVADRVHVPSRDSFRPPVIAVLASSGV